MKGICLKCGLPAHTEMIRKGKTSELEWLHDEYKTAWKVDKAGIAHNLHFVTGKIIKDLGEREIK
jgi:hypothetical protein